METNPLPQRCSTGRYQCHVNVIRSGTRPMNEIQTNYFKPAQPYSRTILGVLIVLIDSTTGVLYNSRPSPSSDRRHSHIPSRPLPFPAASTDPVPQLLYSVVLASTRPHFTGYGRTFGVAASTPHRNTGWMCDVHEVALKLTERNFRVSYSSSLNRHQECVVQPRNIGYI